MGYPWPPRRKRAHKFNLDPGAPRSSKLERAVYELLLLREKAGEIKDIRKQVGVDLARETVKNLRTGKERVRTVRWKVDFSFVCKKTGRTVYCEAKGVETPLYRRQLRLWREGAGPGNLEIWKGDYRRPRMVDFIRLQ